MKIIDQQLADSLLTNFDKELKSILQTDLNKVKGNKAKRK
ncbi:hypothetical protein CLV57_3627 [Mucilaginibacter auburnensis]|uniref:Uncharacterized protein n=1 Tax=Mucilaginibacter auburnensis TaxID=1457233 RepID=A0A2H9VQ76_9SPHI|nr:hypothetical protein CLV57_3627 [Mucilaginibacter auburnensis]